MKKIFTETTNGIKISVTTAYISEEVITPHDMNYFAYTITIENLNNEWVKLLSRHWIIIDADGNKEEVLGEGVVGYFPELEEGQSFTYTSYCPLDTDWGTMEGTYQFVKKDGTMFEAKIPRFVLHKNLVES